MKRTPLLFGLVAMLVAVPAAGRPSGDGPATLVVPIGEISCDTWCGSCSGGHFALGLEPGDGDYQRNDGWHMECNSGSCSNAHGPACPAPVPTPDGVTTVTSELDMQSLIDALRTNDQVSAVEVLLNHGDQVSINLSRSAIQVRGCTGELWAHLPISQEFAGSLGAARE